MRDEYENPLLLQSKESSSVRGRRGDGVVAPDDDLGLTGERPRRRAEAGAGLKNKVYRRSRPRDDDGLGRACRHAHCRRSVYRATGLAVSPQLTDSDETRIVPANAANSPAEARAHAWR